MSAFTMLMHLQLKRTVRYPWGSAVSLVAGPIVMLMNVMLLTSIGVDPVHFGIILISTWRLDS